MKTLTSIVPLMPSCPGNEKAESRKQKADKPVKTVVPMAEGLAWRDPGLCYQEKMDGVFAVREFPGFTLAGEQMAVGKFIAFDVLARNGVDVREYPLRERWRMLKSILHPPSSILSQVSLVPTGNGGAFLAAVLARGGEGVVAKDWSHPYGPMLACKRVATYLCRVTGLGANQAVQIADAATGQPRGAVKLGGGKCDRVRVGSIVKLEAFGEHASGLLREARPCKDTPTSWLVQF